MKKMDPSPVSSHGDVMRTQCSEVVCILLLEEVVVERTLWLSFTTRGLPEGSWRVGNRMLDWVDFLDWSNRVLLCSGPVMVCQIVGQRKTLYIPLPLPW